MQRGVVRTDYGGWGGIGEARLHVLPPSLEINIKAHKLVRTDFDGWGDATNSLC